MEAVREGDKQKEEDDGVRSKLQQVQDHLRHQTGFNILLVALIRLTQKLVRYEVIAVFEKSLLDSAAEITPRVNVYFREASWDDLKALDPEEYHLDGLELKELENNHRCYIGVANRRSAVAEKVLFYIWLNYGRIYDPGTFDIKLSNKQAYLYNAFTHPQYRGSNIYPAALLFISQQLKEQQFEKCFIASGIENRPSLRGIRKAGFQRIGHIFYVEIGALRRTFLSRGLRRFVKAI